MIRLNISIFIASVNYDALSIVFEWLFCYSCIYASSFGFFGHFIPAAGKETYDVGGVGPFIPKTYRFQRFF